MQPRHYRPGCMPAISKSSMKQILAAFLLCSAALPAFAQIADVSSPQPLLRGVQSNLYNPVLSADGSRLLFSNADYSNLRMYDFNLGVTVKISEDARSGYEATFNDDASAVTFVTRTAPDASTPATMTTRRYDVATATVSNDGPQGRRLAPAARKVGKNSVRTVDNVLYINVNGRETSCSPVDAVAYLWASLSPDGSKVMFVAAGKGIYVTDLNGNIMSFAGNYEAPVWLGNDCIVAMKATDDGHQYRSSQILLVRPDGSEVQAITRPESMSMFPTASISAGKIVYCTIDGYLYQVDVTLK